MKIKDIRDEFSQLGVQEIMAKIDAMRQELLSNRLNASTAHVKDYSQFKKLRKNIARGETYIQQKKASKAS